MESLESGPASRPSVLKNRSFASSSSSESYNNFNREKTPATTAQSRKTAKERNIDSSLLGHVRKPTEGASCSWSWSPGFKAKTCYLSMDISIARISLKGLMPSKSCTNPQSSRLMGFMMSFWIPVPLRAGQSSLLHPQPQPALSFALQSSVQLFCSVV